MRRALLPILLSLSAVGCHRDIPSNVPLEWRGVEAKQSASPAVADALGRHGLRVEPFVDRRAEPSVIGSDEDTGVPYRTTANVADFTTQVFKTMFAVSGARLTESDQAASIRGDLVLFHVVEGGLFNGQAVIRFYLVANDGRTLWTGQFEGKSKRWGRTHNPENVNEALSNALAETIERLLHDEAFGRALLDLH